MIRALGTLARLPSSTGSVTAYPLASRSFSSIPAEAWNQPATIISTLSNGVRVASQYVPGETTTVGVWIDAGSRFETTATNGSAHFLEHMAFKGTAKRPRLQLEQEIENMGAHLNAYTAREQTVYYAKAFKQDVPQAMDILADILLNSKLEPNAIDAEKHVILREMEEVEKITEEVIFDRLHMTAFRDNSLGFTILGPEENIRNMNRDHLLQYIRENYTADRTVIAAAGPIDHKSLVNLAESKFAKLPTASTKTPRPQEKKPYFCGSELIYRNDEMGPTAHFAIGYEGVSWTNPDSVAFMVMQSLLGSYRKTEEGLVPGKISANRTTNQIANRMGVGCADQYAAFNTCYGDTGIFGFYAQCDEVAIGHCSEELMFAVASLSFSVTDEEVHRAKLQLMTQMLGALDTTTSVAEDIGRQILVYGRRIPIPEFLKRLEAIDAEEIKRVAWKRLHDVEIAVTALGPLHGLQGYTELRRKTYLHRY